MVLISEYKRKIQQNKMIIKDVNVTFYAGATISRNTSEREKAKKNWTNKDFSVN